MSKVCKISYLVLLKQFAVSKTDLEQFTNKEQHIMWDIFKRYRKTLKIGEEVMIDNYNKQERLKLLRFRKMTYYFVQEKLMEYD